MIIDPRAHLGDFKKGLLNFCVPYIAFDALNMRHNTKAGEFLQGNRVFARVMSGFVVAPL
jgi:hypothetical protein